MEHVHCIFQFFLGCIAHIISNELFLQHYRAFSCTPFVPTFHIHSQYEILFHFSCHTLYKVVIRLFYLSCVSHSLFKLPVLAQHTKWLVSTFRSAFLSQHHVSFPSVVSGISLTNCLTNFFSLIYLFKFLLIHCIITFYCFCRFHAFNQWLNWIPDIPSQVVFFHPYTSLTTYQSLPSIYLLRYNLSTSLLGFSVPCIVINFLVFCLSFLIHL